MMNLYMIPGSTTDWRMYTPQLAEFSNIIIPEWLPPLSLYEPLANYAKRLLATLDLKEPYMLAGVSLGGMLAQEMALLCNPKGVILIATSNSSNSIPLKLRIGGRLARKMPNFIIKYWLKSLSNKLPEMLTNDKIEQKVFAKMLKQLPPQLVRWQNGISTKWQLSRELNVPTFHIHGRKDSIILCERVSPDSIIENGGHFINVTHRQEVNNFIRESLNYKA